MPKPFRGLGATGGTGTDTRCAIGALFVTTSRLPKGFHMSKNHLGFLRRKPLGKIFSNGASSWAVRMNVADAPFRKGLVQGPLSRQFLKSFFRSLQNRIKVCVILPVLNSCITSTISCEYLVLHIHVYSAIVAIQNNVPCLIICDYR